MTAFGWSWEWAVRHHQTTGTLSRRREAMRRHPSFVGRESLTGLTAELEAQLRPGCGDCGQPATLAALVHQVDFCDQRSNDVGLDGARIWLLCADCAHNLYERVAAQVNHRVMVAHAFGGRIGCNSCGRPIEKFHDVVEFARI